MGTRSKKTADSDTAVESDNTRETGESTREYELELTVQAVKEKENHLRAHESALRQQLDQMKAMRRQLETERETFNQTVTTRENDLLMREQELAQKWQDNDLVARIHVQNPPVPQEPAPTFRHNYEYSHPVPQPVNGSPEIKVSFREATESVPYFDGYNIPLSRFTRACRRAREIVPPTAERNLTKLLINKLGNRAYYAVEDEPCESISDLIDLLTYLVHLKL
ncbi:hypothetical protein ALC62_12489 [Cyphomyrmex costatus]|uniref:Uncharacterized protein n=1 Tax=Cyphomyrmex costatus TaxID=456900 RepID=A0A151IBG7_9HYME|nr:hypothetical protein ALC62_12489 [Cyphomyrmex costatus]